MFAGAVLRFLLHGLGQLSSFRGELAWHTRRCVHTQYHNGERKFISKREDTGGATCMDIIKGLIEQCCWLSDLACDVTSFDSCTAFVLPGLSSELRFCSPKPRTVHCESWQISCELVTWMWAWLCCPDHAQIRHAKISHGGACIHGQEKQMILMSRQKPGMTLQSIRGNHHHGMCLHTKCMQFYWLIDLDA